MPIEKSSSMKCSPKNRHDPFSRLHEQFLFPVHHSAHNLAGIYFHRGLPEDFWCLPLRFGLVLTGFPGFHSVPYERVVGNLPISKVSDPPQPRPIRCQPQQGHKGQMVSWTDDLKLLEKKYSALDILVSTQTHSPTSRFDSISS